MIYLRERLKGVQCKRRSSPKRTTLTCCLSRPSSRLSAAMLECAHASILQKMMTVMDMGEDEDEDEEDGWDSRKGWNVVSGGNNEVCRAGGGKR